MIQLSPISKSSLLLILALLFGLDRAYAGIFVVTEDFSSKLVGTDLEVFEDGAGTLNFATIQQQEFSDNPNGVPAYGYSTSTFWYRMTLQNSTAQPLKLYLELGVGWIDHFSVFYKKDGQNWNRSDAGMAYPLEKRAVKNTSPTHVIEIPAFENRQIYVRISSSDTLVFPLYLRAESNFENFIRSKERLYGLFTGIMAVAAFYGFIFFLYTFNRAYLYYVFNTVSWLLMFAVWDGYGREFVFGNNEWWNKNINVLVMCSSLIWGSLFTMRILDVSRHSKRLYQLLVGWVGMQVLIGILVFILPYSVMMKMAASLALLFVPCMLAAIVVGLRSKSIMARYYLLSWTFPLVSALIFNSMTLGLAPGSSLSIYSLHIGVLCQSLFLSFTLSSHLREATRNASVLKVSVEAAGLAHSALMKNELNTDLFEIAYRYKPCQESGGDLFSCLLDPRGRYAYVLVADISGQGITAAIISSAFTGALNSAVKGLHSLDLELEDSCQKILNDVNSVMCDYYGQTNHFASAVLVGIDMRSGAAIYLNAGHRNIFLKQVDGVKAILRGGPLMGFSPVFAPLAVPMKLQPNDMLVLFTDGLVENDFGKSERSRELNISKSLQSLHSPQAVVEKIWQPIRETRNRKSYEDDITLLVVKLKALDSAA